MIVNVVLTHRQRIMTQTSNDHEILNRTLFLTRATLGALPVTNVIQTLFPEVKAVHDVEPIRTLFPELKAIQVIGLVSLGR
jgi:hypothetical protein